MQTEKEGFVYRLFDFKSEEHYQTVKFTEKTTDGKFNPGTTNEEVVQMLIERFYYLQKNNWSAENATIIILLKSVRQLLAKRLNRKIEKVKKYNEQAGPNTDK